MEWKLTDNHNSMDCEPNLKFSDFYFDQKLREEVSEGCYE